MSDAFGECCAQICFECIGRCFLASIIVLFDVLLIKPHGARIIRWGRAIQRTLRIPAVLCPFADSDPGMTDATMRVIAVHTLFTICIVPVGFTNARSPLTINDPTLVIFGIAYPIFAVLTGYALIMVTKGHQNKSRPDHATLRNGKGESSGVGQPATTPLLMDSDLEQEIRAMFAVP
ncbi:uncharacterized protein E0L32_004294 [Thyridium curvatum]|uniref:Uncharacterized protein n=1 Tax=Thyridium curvatum TaxID=1093900 RepID=A0A507B8X0_9PEZI|nr:uncharacterized protein E0L32_004294 [Thyridium curvatum]TPX15596.1 hypothetical protein E0L32_004294 [Thyridium curvatum]